MKKAAVASARALESDASLLTVERAVAGAVRKVIRRYNNRQPDVICIAHNGVFEAGDKKSGGMGRGRVTVRKQSPVDVSGPSGQYDTGGDHDRASAPDPQYP